ncbi:MAG: c-type cytochrome [Burkholderiales bacterium]|nr:c-type cytochrome [Burkholderiales bacterium]
MKLMSTLLLASAALLAAGPASAQIQVLVPTSGEVQATLALKGDIERGRTEFGECQSCHRRDAAGRSAAGIPRLSGQHASVIIKQIMDIRSGRRLNPAMKDYVTDPAQTLQTFADISAYLQSLPMVGNLGKGPVELVPRGKALYEKDCAGCHGEAGEGRAELFHPKLASQHYTYLLQELNLVREGGRGNSNPAMQQILKGFSPDDMRAVASYIAQLP